MDPLLSLHSAVLMQKGSFGQTGTDGEGAEGEEGRKIGGIFKSSQAVKIAADEGIDGRTDQSIRERSEKTIKRRQKSIGSGGGEFFSAKWFSPSLFDRFFSLPSTINQ